MTTTRSLSCSYCHSGMGWASCLSCLARCLPPREAPLMTCPSGKSLQFQLQSGRRCGRQSSSAPSALRRWSLRWGSGSAWTDTPSVPGAGQRPSILDGSINQGEVGEQGLPLLLQVPLACPSLLTPPSQVYWWEELHSGEDGPLTLWRGLSSATTDASCTSYIYPILLLFALFRKVLPNQIH